ncbi:MAG: DUF3794 domain-containing protein [Lachnospiraceae bacterium]|nr:DUF3794 domain-containing protein [Lachnospiraceae bacterium]
MNLIRKNIHMDQMSHSAMTQVSLEEDINLSDSKPDVQRIIYEKGQIQVEEVKPTKDYVTVRGRLLFCMLYTTLEEGGSLTCYEGKIQFEEKIYVEGLQNTDQVKVRAELEHLAIGAINSRKLSVQALIGLTAWVDDIRDVPMPIALEAEELKEGMAYQVQKKDVELAQLVIQKNDILRIREEIQLPASYPNVFDLLWKSVTLEDVEIRPLEDKLSVQGEVLVFVLYEGEGEEHSFRTYESRVPFSGTVECPGLQDRMIPDVRFEIGHQELDVRPDFDGEQRVLGLDMVLDFAMKIYAEETVEMVSDAYGVGCEISMEQKEFALKKLLMRMTGKSKLSGRLKLKAGAEMVLQILHCEGSVSVDHQEITKEGLMLQGCVDVQVLYVSGEDDSPYNCIRQSVPFNYVMEMPGLKETDTYTLHTTLEQLQALAIGGGELDVKGMLCFAVTAFQAMPLHLITDIMMVPMDGKGAEQRPGMVVCVPAKGDTLWSIGKRYGVFLSQIEEVNQIDGEIAPGEKLLIVR